MSCHCPTCDQELDKADWNYILATRLLDEYDERPRSTDDTVTFRRVPLEKFSGRHLRLIIERTFAGDFG